MKATLSRAVTRREEPKFRRIVLPTLCPRGIDSCVPKRTVVALPGHPISCGRCSNIVKLVQVLGLSASWQVNRSSVAKYRRHLEFSALLLLAVAIVWWFGRRLDWQQVKLAMKDSNWRLIALAGVIIGLAYLWRALRWQALLAPLTKASLREIWIATTVGFAAILLVGRTGEVVRPVVLPMRDRRVRPAASFVTIMVERLYDSMTVVLIFAVNLFWFRPAGASAADLAYVREVGWLFVGLLCVAVAGLALFRWRSHRVISWMDQRFAAWPRLPARFKRAVLSILDQLARALGVLANARELAVTVGWSLLLWFSVAGANLLVFRAFGLQFGLTHALFVLGCSMVGSAVPTPGGAAGAFHAATAAALVLLGVVQEKAAAVSIVLHLVDFVPAALFGMFYFLRGDVNLARLRALASTEAVEHAVEDEQIVPEKLEVAAANQ
jgi:uncharacterized protein (TIRG00374 family)